MKDVLDGLTYSDIFNNPSLEQLQDSIQEVYIELSNRINELPEFLAGEHFIHKEKGSTLFITKFAIGADSYKISRTSDNSVFSVVRVRKALMERANFVQIGQLSRIFWGRNFKTQKDNPEAIKRIISFTNSIVSGLMFTDGGGI
ncbi:hypothetical protein HYT02_03050 [Candidatus Gottesmanbacteria bacterium]|nr:hypothetical protein [Candidatus Gottesmanbacteria bacterium]